MALPAEFWKGARAALVGATVLACALTATFLGTGLGWPVEALLGAAAGGAVFSVAAFLLVRLAPLLGRVPARFYAYALAALVTFVVLRETRFGWSESLFYPAALAFLFAQAALGGASWVLARSSPETRRSSKRLLLGLVVLALAIDVGGYVFLASEGRDPYPVERPGSSPTSATPTALDLPNPGEPGPYEIETLTYGSGTDERRPEFGKEVDVTSRVVDASKLLPEWKGFKARAREWYWGFSLEKAPLNARVWLPVGDGPFPLALVVHGNHRMEDYSDAGYAYLGELLASRGFILASVDENFINGTWSGDFGGREMPLRGWLLLEHLKMWREWNRTSGHRLGPRADLSRIALVGHSRGGEAAAIAAAFNELPHHPDDATLVFDYRFDIDAIVAIAQIDRRYPRRMKLDDVNFLALQGSYDADEVSFHGLRQLRRIRFEGDGYWFKAGVYLHRANHGQFNTSWGRRDSGPPGAWLLNVAPIVDGEDQRTVAKVYIGAFLEATLHEDRRYLPLFRDPRAAERWLPDDVALVHQFEDSTFRALADFEEDIDVTTASLEGATIEASGLSLWREEDLRFRDDSSQGTNVAVIGWDGSGKGDSNGGAEPAYTIRLPVEPAAALALHEDARLSFFLSPSTERAPARDDANGESEEDAEEEEEGTPSVPAIAIELADSEGRRAVVPLDDVALLSPFLRTRFLKLRRLNQGGYADPWEATLQSFEIPLSSFRERNGALRLEALVEVSFRLAERPGVVILDDVGFRSEPPAASP